MYTATMTQPSVKPSKIKWWHCVIIYLAANAISFIVAGVGGDQIFYNNFSQPAVAPPSWMFAPVWFVNNVTSLIALYIIANMPENTRVRKSFIRLETINWVLYAVFAVLYFGLKSPVLGAIDTALGMIVTAISFLKAYRLSKKAAWLIAPRLAWLLLATYVSIWMALHNADVLLGTNALFSPN